MRTLTVQENEGVGEERKRFGVCSVTGLLFLSAHIQPPSNTYFDKHINNNKKNQNEINKKGFALVSPAAHAGFGRKKQEE